MPKTNYGTLGVTVPKGTDSPPAIPAMMEAFTDSFGNGQGKGKLVVAQSVGAAKWIAMKGDATLAEDGTLTLTTSYQDIANTTLEITPSVASYLRIWAVFGFRAQKLETFGEGSAIGTVSLDGTDQTSPLSRGAYLAGPNTISGGAYPANFVLALTAAAHTIKLRAKKEENAQFAFLDPAYTHYLYDLVAA